VSDAETCEHNLNMRDEKPYSDKKQRMLDFLTANPVAVLSTVTPDGDPHGAVIYFSVDRQFVVSIMTKSETRKYDNLVHHNHAMLTVLDAETQTTVQLTGVATEVTDPDFVNSTLEMDMLASMKTSYSMMPPIEKLEAGEYVAFKIRPVQVRMAVYARPDPGEYTELFETVEGSELR
jgi:flavin reductase (DIM6/NTAB) family NADH-FMN oxidoreductase RutF